MAILTETQTQVNGQFGSPEMGNNLLGGAFNGEEAAQYNLGQFQVTIGFFQKHWTICLFYKGFACRSNFHSGRR